jgi:AP-3 complex subunit beta
MSLDPALKGDLIPLLHILLVDKIPAVLSCALSAWEHVCPERTDLLHRSYRQIWRVLIEMDEWGQLVAMRVLTVYVRRCFNEPHEVVRNVEFYDNPEETGDPDLELLYKCALQLLHSRSSAVPPPL